MRIINKYWIVIFLIFLFCMFIGKPEVCLFIVGALVFYTCLGYLRLLHKLKKMGVGDVGKIMFYVRERGHQVPVIAFSPAEGAPVQEKPSVYATSDVSQFKSFKDTVGTEVKIIYDPEFPEKFIVRSEKETSYTMAVFCLLIGLLFMAISICGLLGYIDILG